MITHQSELKQTGSIDIVLTDYEQDLLNLFQKSIEELNGFPSLLGDNFTPFTVKYDISGFKDTFSTEVGSSIIKHDVQFIKFTADIIAISHKYSIKTFSFVKFYHVNITINNIIEEIKSLLLKFGLLHLADRKFQEIK